MRIEVVTKGHSDRTIAVLVINGHEITLPQDIDMDLSDPHAIAFFTGYAVAKADFQAALAKAHDHDHDHE